MARLFFFFWVGISVWTSIAVVSINRSVIASPNESRVSGMDRWEELGYRIGYGTTWFIVIAIAAIPVALICSFAFRPKSQHITTVPPR